MTDRQAVLKAIQESAGPSHYLVQFDCDECISIITRKQLFRPPVPVCQWRVLGQLEWWGVFCQGLCGGRSSSYETDWSWIICIQVISSPVMRKRPLRPQRKGGLALKWNARVLRRKNQNSKMKKQTCQAKQNSSTFQLEIGSPAKDSPGKDSPAMRIPASSSAKGLTIQEITSQRLTIQEIITQGLTKYMLSTCTCNINLSNYLSEAGIETPSLSSTCSTTDWSLTRQWIVVVW